MEYCYIGLYVTKISNSKRILTAVLYLREVWKDKKSVIYVDDVFDLVGIKAVMPTTYKLIFRTYYDVSKLKKN